MAVDDLIEIKPSTQIQTGIGANKLVYLGICAAFVAGIVLRFTMRSPLWLDEALTVNISKLPIGQIAGALKRDGAPPLYYFALHFWMKLFGQSPVATRALSGFISLLACFFVYLFGQVLWNKKTGFVSLLLYITSPFGIEYATSVRMYSLIILETAIGGYFFIRAYKNGGFGNFAIIALVTAALVYTHYWSFYLLATVFGGCLIFWKKSGKRRNLTLIMIAILLGLISFSFWLPIFLFQLKHTGTPWAVTPQYTAIINAVTQWAGGNTDFGRILALVYFVLALFAIFAESASGYYVNLNFKSVKRSRLLAVAIFAVLFLAVSGAIISKSAYSPRYTAVGVVMFLVFLSSGLLIIENKTILVGLLGLACISGIAGGIANAWDYRSEAGVVAAKINQYARSGDIVLFCPDQLGPAVVNLLKPGLQEISFPAYKNPSPAYVDWIDYAKRNENANYQNFVNMILSKHPKAIYYVWEEGYLTYGTDCESIHGALSTGVLNVIEKVSDQPNTYYEHEHLTEYIYSRN
jgi:mannosyltransferase